MDEANKDAHQPYEDKQGVEHFNKCSTTSLVHRGDKLPGKCLIPLLSVNSTTNKVLHKTGINNNFTQTCSDLSPDNQQLLRLPSSSTEIYSEGINKNSKQVSSPHRLIHLESLKETVRLHFGPCT